MEQIVSSKSSSSATDDDPDDDYDDDYDDEPLQCTTIVGSAPVLRQRYNLK